MKKLVITDAARADLKNIAWYTEQEWGAAQKQRYLGAIRDRFARLQRHQTSGSPRDEIAPGYRSVQIGRHVIFYRESADRIEIIRVLHGRMDLHRHLTPHRGES